MCKYKPGHPFLVETVEDVYWLPDDGRHQMTNITGEESEECDYDLRQEFVGKTMLFDGHRIMGGVICDVLRHVPIACPKCKNRSMGSLARCEDSDKYAQIIHIDADGNPVEDVEDKIGIPIKALEVAVGADGKPVSIKVVDSYELPPNGTSGRLH